MVIPNSSLAIVQAALGQGLSIKYIAKMVHSSSHTIYRILKNKRVSNRTELALIRFHVQLVTAITILQKNAVIDCSLNVKH